MRLTCILLPLLAACGERAETDPVFQADAYVPPAERHQEYTPPDDTAADPLMLRVEDGDWVAMIGPSWAQGAEVGRFAVRTDDGLWAGDTQLLPADVAVGATGEGVEVVAIEDHTTYYGTFEQAVTVEIADGPWAGTQVLARGFGPVTATLDGDVWDLVYYE